MIRPTRPTRLPVAALAAALLASTLPGCESMAVTTFGVGASTGVAHTLNGYAYRTFTAPAGRVKDAAQTALRRMDIKVAASRKVEAGEVLEAKAKGRDIEIALEALSANTTRMRAVAKEGLLNDGATAVEIITQTERVLNGT